jgi:hypothetical protein
MKEYSNLSLCIRIQMLLTLYWPARIYNRETHWKNKLFCLHSQIINFFTTASRFQCLDVNSPQHVRRLAQWTPKNDLLWETVIPRLKINLTPEIRWLLCSFVMSMKIAIGCALKLIFPLLCNEILNNDAITKILH